MSWCHAWQACWSPTDEPTQVPTQNPTNLIIDNKKGSHDNGQTVPIFGTKIDLQAFIPGTILIALTLIYTSILGYLQYCIGKLRSKKQLQLKKNDSNCNGNNDINIDVVNIKKSKKKSKKSQMHKQDKERKATKAIKRQKKERKEKHARNKTHKKKARKYNQLK